METEAAVGRSGVSAGNVSPLSLKFMRVCRTCVVRARCLLFHLMMEYSWHLKYMEKNENTAVLSRVIQSHITPDPGGGVAFLSGFSSKPRTVFPKQKLLLT